MKTLLAVVVMTGSVLLAQQPADVMFTSRTFEYVSGQLVGGEQVKGAPYSATAVNETSQTLADGNKISRNSSSMLYRDSLGRERREGSVMAIGPLSPQGEPGQTVFISDPVSGVNYELNPKTKTARKIPGPHVVKVAGTAVAGDLQTAARGVLGTVRGGFTAATPLPLPPGAGVGGMAATRVFTTEAIPATGPLPEPKTEQLGSRNIEGVEATGTRTTITIPAHQIGNERPIDIVSERWYSAQLKTTVLSIQSDPRTGETTYKLTGINLSEPQHSLFEVPADYTLTEMPALFFDRTVAKPEE